MAFCLMWSPRARLDLTDLREYIAEDNPRASVDFVKAVFAAVERLADFPLSGRVVPEFGDPMIREVIRRPCRIVYRIKELDNVLEIVRIWHAARGIPEC